MKPLHWQVLLESYAQFPLISIVSTSVIQPVAILQRGAHSLGDKHFTSDLERAHWGL